MRPRLITAWPTTPVPALVLTLFLTIALASPVPALEFRKVSVGLFAHSDIDIKGDNLGGLGLSLSAAAPLWSPAAGGQAWRLDLRLEAEADGFWNYAMSIELSLLPGLHLYIPSALTSYEVRLFLEGGLGLSRNNLHIHELASGFNFLF